MTLKLPHLALAILFAVAASLADLRAQSPERALEEMNAARDAAIAENAAGLAERAAVDQSIGAEIIDLKSAASAAEARLDDMSMAIEALAARVEALEEAGPVEPPDPGPSLTLYLVNADGALIAEPITDLVTVDGPFSICAFEEDGVEGPVKFVWDGDDHEESRSGFCLFGGDSADFPTGEWAPGEHALTVTASNLPPRTVDIKVNGPTGPPPGDARAKLQVGIYGAVPYNFEDPFLNFFKANNIFWEGGGLDTPALIAAGFVDGKTGLPRSGAGAPGVRTTGYFEFGQYSEFAARADGDWIVELEAEGDCAATINAVHTQGAMKRQTGPCRFEFTRDVAGGRSASKEQFTIANVKSPITAMRLFRKEHEALVRAGRLYNPEFLAEACKYDVLRPMDLQSANAAVIRSVDDMAPMNAAAWGAADYSNATSEYAKWPAPVQGMPPEAVFRLGVECGREVWFQAPMTLGAPRPFFDFARSDNRIDVWSHRFAESASADAAAVLDSEEWDRYADRFVADLIESGYPADRPLYVALANEVWNWSGHYFLTTKYAERMGDGLGEYLGVKGTREAYGAMTARLKRALDAALSRAGRAQDIVYVIEGQAAYVELTGAALKGAKAYMEKHGEAWADHAPAFGVSVASYWGYPDRMIAERFPFDDLDKLEDHLLNGPADYLGTAANIVRLFEGAEKQAAPYGVRLIGAYEGGPHFTRPWVEKAGGERNYLMTQENYRAFIWGPRGARVNCAVITALAKRFPGIILSNYALAGPVSDPWFEGRLGAQNPYAQSWLEGCE